MTHSDATNQNAQWAIEIERLDTNQPSEFFSITGLQVVRDTVKIVTSGGTQITFKSKNVRRILVMRAKDKST